MTDPRMTIGAHSYICQPFHIHGDRARLTIGKYCSIAINFAVDLGYQHNYKNITTFPMHRIANVPENLWCKGDVVIGNDVWIGENVTVMGGVTIGDGAVIGANSTVRSDVGPYEIYTDNDKKKFRFDAGAIAALLWIAWWNWEDEKVIANAPLLASGYMKRFLEENL